MPHVMSLPASLCVSHYLSSLLKFVILSMSRAHPASVLHTAYLRTCALVAGLDVRDAIVDRSIEYVCGTL